jgi:hypothetical protein
MQFAKERTIIRQEYSPVDNVQKGFRFLFSLLTTWFLVGLHSALKLVGVIVLGYGKKL